MRRIFSDVAYYGIVIIQNGKILILTVFDTQQPVIRPHIDMAGRTRQMKRERCHPHGIRQRIFSCRPAIFETDDLVIQYQPQSFTRVSLHRPNVTLQHKFKLLLHIVEHIQSGTCRRINGIVPVRHQLPVIDRRLMRPVDGHVLERMPVVHEQCVSTAEPYPADAIFHDAVYTSVIGSFRHLMEAVILRIDSV